MTAETVEQAARRLFAPKIALGYVPRALHTYVNADGQPIYYRARLEHPDGDAAPNGRKIIRPVCLNGSGYKIGEPDFPERKKPLYNLDRIAADERAPVFIVEGEKAADALTKCGAIATTSGGADSAQRADWSPLAGRVCLLWPDNDDAGRGYMGDVAAILVPLGCRLSAVNIAELNLPAKGDAVDWLADRTEASASDLLALPMVDARPAANDATANVLSGPRAVVRRLSEVETRPVRWLWPGRIARGKVSMIAGHPGLGKSQITAALAAVVTTGGTWPVDYTRCEQGSVVLLNAEDDASDTIKPRLEAAGADVDHCLLLDAVREHDRNTGEPVSRGFSLKTDLAVLDALLLEHPDTALVVIDPITAYLANVDSHVNADVRAVLAPLGELASRHGVAIVCVTHLNKGSGTSRGSAGDALLRVSGSLAFVAAARAAYLVAVDADDKTRRLFVPAKNNIGPDQTGLAFSVESHTLPSGIQTSRVLWEPTPVTVSADEAMAPAEDSDRTMTEEAVELLRDMLVSGRVLARDVKRRANDAGITDKALRTARGGLGIQVTREGFGGDTKSYWALPGGTHDASHSRPPTSFVPVPALVENRAQVDPEGTNGGDVAPGSGHRWRVTRPGGESFTTTTVQPATLVEMQDQYAGSRVEPADEASEIPL